MNAEANGNGNFITAGDASGKRMRVQINIPAGVLPFQPSSVGSPGFKAIGAGIAVDTIGIDNRAVIEDGVAFNVADGKLSAVNAAASFTGTHRIEAAAGAEGGTSIMPVLALSLGGVNTTSYIGRNSSEKALEVAGDVTLAAHTSMTRNLVSDAQAAGVKVGMGAAFGVIVVSDNAEAELVHSVNAKNVIIDASSISRVNEDVRASSRGIRPAPGTGIAGGNDTSTGNKQEDVEKAISQNTTTGGNVSGKKGGVDKTIDSGADALKSLAAKLPASKSGNLSATKLNDLTAKRPAAATSEGNVQIAAALAANILFNGSAARIGDNVEIIAAEDVSLTSKQDTDAIIKATAAPSSPTWAWALLRL